MSKKEFKDPDYSKPFDPKKRVRAWCFTWNNWDVDTLFFLQNEVGGIEYLCYGKEIAPSTGTPHLQGYVYFTDGKTLSSLKKKWGNQPRFCHANGTGFQNKVYCSKDKDFYETGECPVGQGARSDLSEVKDEIVAGTIKVDDIIIERPMMYHQYGRTLNAIEDVTMRGRKRNFMTEGIWYYGPTGVGKSHAAFTCHGQDYYVWPNDNGWWDGYRQQPTVIINEFRGQIPYSEMLSMVDKWPHYVSRRCREPMPFMSKLVVVTSALHPKDVYHNLSKNDDLAQLIRRFEIIELETWVSPETKFQGTMKEAEKHLSNVIVLPPDFWSDARDRLEDKRLKMQDDLDRETIDVSIVANP